MVEVILSERTLAWFATDLQDANERIIKLEEENRLLKKEAEYWKNESKKKDKEIKSKKEVIRYYRKEKAKLVEKNLILTLDLWKEIKKNLILEASLNAGFTKLL